MLKCKWFISPVGLRREPITGHTVDERNPAPIKPWNDDSPENTNKQGFPIVSQWCEMDFVHPQYDYCFPRTVQTEKKRGLLSPQKVRTRLCRCAAPGGDPVRAADAWLNECFLALAPCLGLVSGDTKEKMPLLPKVTRSSNTCHAT